MVIYKITNLINGKIYIGQTVQTNPKQRWWDHLSDADAGVEYYLYNAMRKYGNEHFVWKIVDEATDIDELNIKEDLWLEAYKKQCSVYNIRRAGNNQLHAPESIERMRVAQRNAHARRRHAGTDGGWVRKDGGPMKGKTHTKETKKKMSIAANNRPPVTEEARKKMSESAKLRYKK